MYMRNEGAMLKIGRRERNVEREGNGKVWNKRNVDKNSEGR